MPDNNMPDNNKLELGVEVDVNKANASIKSRSLTKTLMSCAKSQRSLMVVVIAEM